MCKVITGVRAVLPACVGALAWILAGVGWGVVIGALLETSFGSGTVDLLDVADGAALVGSGGALFGAVAMGLVMTGLNLLTLVPLFILLSKISGANPPGQEGVGIMDEVSARSAALVSVILGVFGGMTAGAMCGAGIALEEVYGKAGPTPALHWGTALGALVGGILGLVELGWTVVRSSAGLSVTSSTESQNP